MADLGWDYLTREDASTVLRGIRAGEAFGGPYHVEIHPAGRCNVECFFCSTASIRGNDQMEVTSFLGLIDELQTLGTRSVRLSGGGEPLFHQNIGVILDRLWDAGLRIENLTTNGVLMRGRAAEQLVRGCDRITISLNAGDAESYGEMMQTSPKNFDRVLQNIRSIVKLRTRRMPLLNLQFLVWRDNYFQIPDMYRLARDLEVDSVMFNGLSFLPPEKQMSKEQRVEMLDLYEQIIEQDEYRTICSIASYEKGIEEELREINQRVGARRSGGNLISKAARFLGRNEFTLREKLRHWTHVRQIRRIAEHTAGLVDDCVIGWHSMVVKTSGDVSPCCILQHRSLGNVFRESVEQVWYGAPYQQLRAELRQILVEHESWEPANSSIAIPMCAGKTEEACPIKTIYRSDIPFSRALNELADQL